MDNDNKHDEYDAIIRRLQPRPSLSSRPLLIFNHNPKAGGGSVLKTIRGFKTNEIQCRSGNRKESGCQPNQWNRINRIISLSSNLKKKNNSSSLLSSFSSNNNNTDTDNINNTFIHIGEFSKTTAQDKERGYIIGTIREPCSQYVSLWSFGSINNGAFRNYQVRDTELYGQSPPYFNTTDDIQSFHKWMNHPLVIGEIGRRVTVSYGNNDDNDNGNNSIVNNVDCWVVVENFQQTLFDCLLKYENQGGYVDWTSTTVSQLKDKIQVEEKEEENNNSHHHHHSHRYLGRNSRNHSRKFKRFYSKGSKKRKNDHSKDDNSKNDPLGDPRSQHHASCHIFFATTTTTQNDNNDNNDNYLIQQVMSPKNELFIYKQFGYDGCCTTNIPTIVGTTLTSTSSLFLDNGNKSKSSNNNTETETEFTTGDSGGGVSSSSSSFSSSPPTTTTMNNASFLPSTSSILIFNKHKKNTPTTTTTSISILISFLFAGGFFIMIYRLRGWIDNLSCSSKQQRSSKSS